MPGADAAGRAALKQEVICLEGMMGYEDHCCENGEVRLWLYSISVSISSSLTC